MATVDVPLDERQRAMVRTALRLQAATLLAEEPTTLERRSALEVHSAEYTRLAEQMEEVETW